MTKDEALRLALEALENASNAIESWGSYASEYFQDKHDLQTDINNTQQAITAIKASLEAKDEKDGSPCPKFWDWLPKAYRNGDADDLPKFTKYNMEVAFLAGKQSVALEAKDEPVAWAEEIIDDLDSLYNSEMIKENDSGDALIRLDAAVCVVEEVAQKHTTPPQRKPLQVDKDGWYWLSENECIHVDLIRKVEAAHGIKGEE